MHHLPSAALAALAAAIVGSQTSAQGPAVAFQIDPLTDWDGVHDVDDSLLELLAGDFDGDGRTDALARCQEGRLVMAREVGHRHDRYALRPSLAGGGAAVNVSGLARFGAVGAQPDSFLTASPAGLHRWLWDDSVGGMVAYGFSSPSQGYIDVAFSAVGPGGFDLAYGLRDDRRTVDSFFFSSADGQLLMAGPSQTLDEAVSRIWAAEIDGDGLADLVVTDSAGLKLRSLVGTNLGDYHRSGSSPWLDVVVPIADPGSPTEQLAWYESLPSAGQLTTIDRVQTWGPLALAGGEVLNGTAGDLDHDGLADLVLAQSDDAGVQVLYAQTPGTSAPRFELGSHAVDHLAVVNGGFAALGSAGRAGIAAADLDGDGDVDLLQAQGLGATDYVAIYRSTAEVAKSLAPTIDLKQCKIQLDGAGEAELIVAVDAPALAPPSDRLRVRIWNRPDVGYYRLKDEPLVDAVIDAPSFPLSLSYSLNVNSVVAINPYVEVFFEEPSGARRYPADLAAMSLYHFLTIEGEGPPATATYGAGVSYIPSGGGGTTGTTGTDRVPPRPPLPDPITIP